LPLATKWLHASLPMFPLPGSGKAAKVVPRLATRAVTVIVASAVG
jgi:hypothetical protein